MIIRNHSKFITKLAIIELGVDDFDGRDGGHIEDNYNEIKKTIKSELIKFFKNTLIDISSEIMILIKDYIKNINLMIKKEYLYDKKQIQQIIKYNLLKSDNIFDNIMQIYAYQKYIDYIKLYQL